MRLYSTLAALLASVALFVVVLPSRAPAQNVKGPISAVITNVGDKVGAYCPGYSSVDIFVPAGTLSGATVTAYTAPNTGTFAAPSPGPSSTPAATIAGNTLSSFPGHIYLSLISASYAYAVLTANTSGSATATILCTGAVAAQPPGPFVTPAPGSSSNVALYPTEQPSNDPSQSGSSFIGGGYYTYGQKGKISVLPTSPSPGPVGFSEANTTNAKSWNFDNDADIGPTGLGNQFAAMQYNNQGMIVTEWAMARNGTMTTQGGGGYRVNTQPTPAAPVPTCAPLGSNASLTYNVEVNLEGSVGHGAVSAEATVTCAANTVLVVPLPSLPPNTVSSTGWTVDACVTCSSGQEMMQTQGTSPTSGVNIPFLTTSWESTATLAGSTPAPVIDSSLGTWGDANGTFMKLAPQNTSLFSHAVTANSNTVLGSTTAGLLAPVKNLTNAAVGTTWHCVWGTATASASTATFAWSANDAFAVAGNWVVTLYDKTTATPRMATALGSVTTTGFTIATTGTTDVMYAEVCGT